MHAAPGRAVRACAATVLRIDQVTGEMAAAGVGMLVSGVLVMMQRKPQRCEICGGAGHWECVICDGEGYLGLRRERKKCVACVGRGKRLCKKCEGSGWDKKTNYIG